MTTKAAIEEAKNWIRDCRWRDDEDGQASETWIDELEDLTVMLGINLHYAGGWIQFLMDNNLSAEHSPNASCQTIQKPTPLTPYLFKR